jgi:Asp-tRNA(Asn)/Glu-tRNA(Gln) amidotransferase A subunit family amidase
MCDKDLSGVRLGVFREYFDDADPAIVTACDRALGFLVSRGATVGAR